MAGNDFKWFWARDGKQFGPLDQAAMLRLIDANEIKPFNLIWREGYPEWVLVDEDPVFASKFGAVGTDSNEIIREKRNKNIRLLKYVHLKKFTNILFFILCIGIIMNLFRCYLIIGMRRYVSGVSDGNKYGFGLPNPDDFDKFENFIMVPQFIILILTFILFLRWIYISNRNVHALGAKLMKFSPGWSVGWYFIPVASFWKPFQAMNEIWKGSKNPASWRQEETPAFLRWWWFLFLVHDLAGRIAAKYLEKADGVHQFQNAATMLMVSMVIDIAYLISGMVLIWRISNFQTASWRKKQAADAVEASLS